MKIQDCGLCGLSGCRCKELGIVEDITERDDYCEDCKSAPCCCEEYNGED